MIITQATVKDMEGVMALLKANHVSNMTEEDSYVSTLMCCLEQIRCGVTSFAEPGGQFVSGMAKATAESGLRGKLAKSVMDCGTGLPAVWQKTTQEELDKQLEDLEKYHNTADGRVQVWFGLRTIFNNTDDLIVKTKELADKYNVGIHMHVAEAKSEIDYTNEVYGENTVTHLHNSFANTTIGGSVSSKNLALAHKLGYTVENSDL